MSGYNYDDRLDIFKQPQEYKGVKFYPLKVKEYMYLDKLYELFGFPKRFLSEKSPLIFKMTYLKFLLFAVGQMLEEAGQESNIEQDLIDFLSYVTRTDDISIGIIGVPTSIDTFEFTVKINETVFSAQEFDIIRMIVLKQNGSSLEYIEAFNDKLEASLNFARKNKSKYTLKDKIFAFATLFRRTIDEVGECSVYEMENALESMSAVLAFKMHTIPLTSVKEGYEIPPYVAHLGGTKRYDEILVDTDTFKQESQYFKSPKDLMKIKK